MAYAPFQATNQTAAPDPLDQHPSSATPKQTVAAPVTIARGDGIGPEIMDAVLLMLESAGARLDLREIEIGERVYRRGVTAGIERTALGEARVEAEGFVPPLRGNPIWLAVNRGELSLAEAKSAYVSEQSFAPNEIDALWEALYASFPLITDTRVMMDELKSAGYRLFSITDNVHEIVSQLRRDYDFFDQFEAVAVSAELGFLKPDPRIYNWLLETGGIEAHESVFLDDVQRNVDGAKAVGMQACLFTTAAKAREDLRALGVRLPEAV